MNLRSVLRKFKNTVLALKCFYHFIRLSRDSGRTDDALALVDRLYDLGLFQWSVDRLKADPLTAKVFENPLKIPPFDVDGILANHSPDTLGHIFATQMKSQGLDPNYFRRFGTETDGAIIASHLDQTHDLWHVVTGFDTSVPGEVGLQAFMLGQLRTPQSIVFVGGAIVRCLFTNQRELFPIMDHIARGWKLSQKWPPFFALHWGEILGLPLEHIRKELDEGRLPVAPKSKVQHKIQELTYSPAL